MKVVVLILALLAALGHAWLSHQLGKDRMEALLEVSLRQELGSDPQFRGVDVEYEYLDGVLTGELPSRDMEELTEAFAEERRLAGRISSEIKLGPPPDQPAKLTVEFDGRFRMTGVMPDAFSRSALEDDLRLLDRGQVQNQIEVSTRVIPPKWDGVTSRVFEDFFQEPGYARLEITADEVRLKRKFEGGEERRKELLAAANPLRELGLKVIDELELVRDQPADVKAVQDGKGRLTVTGRLGSAADRELLLKALRPLLAEQGDGLELQETVVPAEWASSWGVFVSEFMKEVRGGEASVEGSTVVLKGALPASMGKRIWVERAAKAIGPGCEVEDHLTLVPDLEPSLRIAAAKKQVILEGTLPRGDLADTLVKTIRQAGFDEVQSAIDVNEAAKTPPWGDRITGLLTFCLQQTAAGLAPSSLSFQPGLVSVKAKVQQAEDRERLLALSKAVVPESWALDFNVEVSSLRAPTIAGEAKGGGGILRGLLPPQGLIEELQKFAKERTGAPVISQLTSAMDVRAPALKNSFAPFLETFFREVSAGSFELGEQGWILAGSVSTEEAKRQILAEAEKLVGPGLPMRDGLRVVPPPEPFLLVAQQGSGGWSLSGRLPDEASRRAIRSALPPGNPAPEAADTVVVASVTKVPAWLAKLPDFLREASARLTEARVGVEENKLSLEGKHLKMEGKEELLALSKQTFGDLMVIEDKTWMPKPAPAQVPRLHIRLLRDRVSLAGDLGDPSEAQALVAAAKAAVPRAEVANDLHVSPEISKAQWMETLAGFLPSFAVATLDGEIEVAQQQIALRGKVKDAASRDALLANFAKALPDQISLRDELEILKQPSATDQADTFTLYFGSASTFVSVKARQTLAAAAAAIQSADRASTVLIKGYADVLGEETANLELSRERAQQVYRELVKAGVDAKQLEFIGVGETESRARSRFDLRFDRKVEIKLVR